ncbi:ComF family protein [Marinicella sp. S1101]|uniref:ComF family protein n=1 Tax=Marinicella marina TaxID=2996016 RepID=UPI002260C3EF|nr:ComF family protein [Marinicella marina]MCX7552787.1 ComF family protein [Marinicella marina]MDJ1139904.1 ComF family protein [Marinicella marina]
MQRCAICHVHSTTGLCSGCQSLIKAPENPCLLCAKPLPHAGAICGECRSDSPAFNQTICAAIYQAPIDKWIQQLKFGEQLDRARLMAEALLSLMGEIDQHIPLIPMPLHINRLRKRGYNQAFEIARIIAKKQNRALLGGALIRVKNTAMQAELHEKQRIKNVRSAFRVNQAIGHNKVVLIDDVMTTGQTMRSAAKCLVGAGVQEVIVVVFARSGG